MSGCAMSDAMLGAAQGLFPSPAASCVAGHDLGELSGLHFEVVPLCRRPGRLLGPQSRSPCAGLAQVLIAFHVLSHSVIFSAGALADSSALRGHPQAQALLGQLRQPFDTSLASSASKVQNSASP